MEKTRLLMWEGKKLHPGGVGMNEEIMEVKSSFNGWEVVSVELDFND